MAICMVSMSVFFCSLRVGFDFDIVFSMVWFGVNHILRVGGSVFNLSFQNEIPHLISLTCQRPRQKTESKKKRKEKSNSLQGDACFHGNAEHVLVCMMTSCMHFLLGSLFFCQDADSVSASTEHMVQSHVRLLIILKNGRNPPAQIYLPGY